MVSILETRFKGNMNKTMDKTCLCAKPKIPIMLKGKHITSASLKRDHIDLTVYRMEFDSIKACLIFFDWIFFHGIIRSWQHWQKNSPSDNLRDKKTLTTQDRYGLLNPHVKKKGCWTTLPSGVNFMNKWFICLVKIVLPHCHRFLFL